MARSSAFCNSLFLCFSVAHCKMNLKGSIFVFVALFLWHHAVAAQCPACGNTTVPYPLSTSPSCGQPGYSISCSPSNQLELKAVSGSYPILSINPQSRSLVIAPGSLAKQSCATTDLPNRGLVLNSSHVFNVSSSNTVMLLNCSQVLLLSPLNCSSNSVCHQYLQSAPQAKACGNSLCCSFRAGGSSTSYMLKVSDINACTAYVSVVNLDPSVSPSGWNYGVELDWMAPMEPLCPSNQSCGGNSTCSQDRNKVSRCLCNAGFRWDSFSGTCLAGAVCGSNGSGDGCPGSRSHTRLIAGLTSGLGAALLLIIILALIYRKRQAAKQAKINRAKHMAELMSAHGGGKTAKIFTPREMKRATNSFSRARVLGSGGFGEVFKGILDDGTLVAIKAAKLGNIQGRDHVINEVCILSQVNHRNLVRLLGVCVEMEEPLLVYEFISNGTLFDYLKKSGGKGSLLDWKSRIRIAHQTAEGLAYLHSAAYPPIYHRDVKSSNILLDENMNAKVSDFGLSRLAKPDLTHVSTCAQGTLGYLDPEYYRNYQLTDKSDVYSFGVVLLEIITSQRAIDFSRAQDEVNLAIYVMTKSESGHALEVVDPELLASASSVVKDSILAATLLALSCLQESRTDRPTMKEVAEELQYIASIEDVEVSEHYEDKLAR
ncbi:hypothetical protein O6H91_06G088700 [Diphasiastrum complanatum]|uniref:Uncharacterized protein n=2 Tax=Diphasiastrum complanatum TaxID=34168 RepID=A0ACC2DGC2_DIPCM|nr:hypothetical protein O6H91_06G088700 [Diphasiastrum complanatum]KAJ7553221.1 hypothetical protein O6H91_06G088700 [Diphasiastrum complanatum]